MNIEISKRAVDELVKMDVTGEKFLRIAIVSGGCSGLTYSAGIDKEAQDDDIVLFEKENLRVMADMKSALYLDGLKIDYSDDLLQAGFKFSNPRAKKSCGCGNSFSA